MKIEWLESFHTTAEYKSLTKASEHLNMSQPALSKQIKSLEHDIGAHLFIRSASGVELTTAGKILHDRSVTILNEIRSMRREILISQGSGNLTLGSWPSVSTFYIPKKLASVTNEVPNGSIKIKISHTFSELLSGLEQGEIDVIMCDESVIKHTYWTKPLFSESFMLFIHSQHPLASKKDESIMLQEISKEQLFLLPTTCDIRMIINREFEHKGLPLNIAAEIEFGQSILGFISNNLGVSILPEIFKHHITDENIIAIPISDFEEQRTISVIARNEDTGKRLYQIFRNH
ncbi:LysR family transcriptional regulator [Longirhabdus pacifica]|uniref:LysR family transcriptional regulator n=1 Tax=Longirhabdus pacifica TaxID=2305227 RepID=UPI001008BB2B|nr:LysR family transcriptional regulator [Longirhabdus pacifica]